MPSPDHVNRPLVITFAVLLLASLTLVAVSSYGQHRTARKSMEAAQIHMQESATMLATVERDLEAMHEAIVQNFSAHAAELLERTGVAIEEGAEPGDDALADMHFLTGTWRGEMNGEFVEEIWSAPQGNAMMGMFRWVNADGGSRMYELLTISREDQETFLRLRHFSAAMVAWEEKDAPVVLRLAELDDRRAAFVNESPEDRLERIVFHQPEPGTLAIDVVFREGSGRAPLNFRLNAVK